MYRTVVIVPGLLAENGSESVLRQRLPALFRLAERGTISKIAKLPRVETPEAMLLGFSPSEAQMAQGPLTVAALGADPPERSTHFHLSLLSLSDGVATTPAYLPSSAANEEIWQHVKRLDTSRLTLLRGHQLDHGLVWEGLGDIGTTTARDLEGQAIREHFPQGDADRILRRLIDDSVNILSELEFNRRREDEGVPPLNLLWPWGAGIRLPIPNLTLRRREPAVVESNSMRLAGLTRLAGYRHIEHSSIFSMGAERDWQFPKRNVAIVVFDEAERLRKEGDLEKIAWFAAELDRQVLGNPSLESETPHRLTLLLPGAEEEQGLALVYDSEAEHANAWPFDERVLDERKVPTRDLWTLVEAGVTL